jgi:hypothetical protein
MTKPNPDGPRARLIRENDLFRAVAYPRLPYNVRCPICDAPAGERCTKELPNGSRRPCQAHPPRRPLAAAARKRFLTRNLKPEGDTP